MGSGRGDRNQQPIRPIAPVVSFHPLQWGPVVVTGISSVSMTTPTARATLQWGPVVVTGIRLVEVSMTRGELYPLQWGPVVVTGISGSRRSSPHKHPPLQWGPVVVTGIRGVSSTTSTVV